MRIIDADGSGIAAVTAVHCAGRTARGYHRYAARGLAVCAARRSS